MDRKNYSVNKIIMKNRKKNQFTIVSIIARDKIINHNNISDQTIRIFLKNNNFECVKPKKI